MLRLLILSRKGKMIELPCENRQKRWGAQQKWTHELIHPPRYLTIIHGKLLQQVKTKEFWDHVPQVHFDHKKKGKIQHIPPLPPAELENGDRIQKYKSLLVTKKKKKRIWREAGGKVHKSLKSKSLWAVFQKWRDILLKLQHRSWQNGF